MDRYARRVRLEKRDWFHSGPSPFGGLGEAGDDGELAAGVLGFAAIGEEMFGEADGAEAGIKDLLSRDARGC